MTVEKSGNAERGNAGGRKRTFLDVPGSERPQILQGVTHDTVRDLLGRLKQRKATEQDENLIIAIVTYSENKNLEAGKLLPEAAKVIQERRAAQTETTREEPHKSPAAVRQISMWKKIAAMWERFTGFLLPHKGKSPQPAAAPKVVPPARRAEIVRLFNMGENYLAGCEAAIDLATNNLENRIKSCEQAIRLLGQQLAYCQEMGSEWQAKKDAVSARFATIQQKKK